MTNDPN